MAGNLVAVIEVDIGKKELARTINWLRWKNDIFRGNILEKADREISGYAGEAGKLVMDLCNDEANRVFFRDAGIDYYNIREPDSRLIRVAVAYLLLNQGEVGEEK